MKMMVETAAQADQTQFILITPQDMGVSSRSSNRRCCGLRADPGIADGQGLSHSGDEVKIVKLADPSRASGEPDPDL